MPRQRYSSFGKLNVRAAVAPRVASAVVLLALTLFLSAPSYAQRKRRPPAGGRVAVVVDERLSALRDAPELSANLL
ncbi:MAG TPA: hypothetical protein VNZ44_08305, partial [Pyrinomonadaceae bacterium]|nr:hypothetical protein [Pyrinomonadaceae bacterium]